MKTAAKLLVLCFLCYKPFVPAQQLTPEELFQKAKEFYGNDSSGNPNAPSGYDCLLKAAAANYSPALYNLTVGYRYAYLGAKSPQKAAHYRARWLESLDTSVAYFQLGYGLLGAW